MESDAVSLSGRNITLCVPPDLTFFDLNLRWSEEGQILFDWEAIERLCQASGIDCDFFRRAGESNVVRLINHWYEIHLRNGGPADMVKEEAMRYASTLCCQPAAGTRPH